MNAELKLNALSSINLLDGAVMVSRNGTLTARGSVVAEGGIKTNTIRALNQNDNINISLKQQDQNTETNKKLQITNELGQVNASIDASGEGYFKQGIGVEKYTSSPSAIIAAQQNFNERGIYAPALKTNSEAAGTGIIPSHGQEILIYNEKVKATSLIYVTATSATENKLLFVADKQEGQYFKVALDGNLNHDVTFNWWIVN
jgi:hypothetical protein